MAVEEEAAGAGMGGAAVRGADGRLEGKASEWAQPGAPPAHRHHSRASQSTIIKHVRTEAAVVLHPFPLPFPSPFP